MTTSKEVLDVISGTEKENIKLELKRSALLRSDEGQRKIAYAITALANRNGGRLFIGVNDDGTLEGKDIFDIDNDKGIIENICHMKISPIVEYNTELVECPQGDVLVVNIRKRKEIPHAYIVSRKGPEIKNRIYYIRTGHGKRLVSDRQLQWLFNHQEDPDFSFPFRIVINYLKDTLQISEELQQPAGTYDYTGFLDVISEKDIAKMTKDWLKVQSFFTEISPYVLINSFSWLFKSTWLIKIHRHKGMLSSRPVPSNAETQTVSVANIPVPGQDTVSGSLSWDFVRILESGVLPDFCVPMGTKLDIQYDKSERKSTLIINHKDFTFQILFNSSAIGAGIHFAHPQRQLLINQNPDKKIERLFQYIEMDCVFNASFNFPEEDVELFNEYYHYAKSIKNHLKYDWDYDNFIDNMPPDILYSIESRLDRMEKHILQRFPREGLE